MNDVCAVRLCRRGHLVAVEKRTGRIKYSRGRPSMICLECKQRYESDVRALGLRK